jgi:predicted enzyme related to lactoylglutathione lyase
MTDSRGHFVWYELTTTDTEAAQAFYSAVVGWGRRDVSRPGMPYSVFTAGEAPVGGVRELPKQARESGERPMWLGYVCVDDVDAVANRVGQLGGFVHLPPQDALDVSRFSVVSDPHMATFALFKWRSPPKQDPVNRFAQGRIGWHELLAPDCDKAWAFYSELFGWQKTESSVSSVGPYQQFSAGGQTIGGMMATPPTVVESCWLYYFNVGDIDAALKRVKSAGGQLLSGPMEVPDGTWMAQCTDPQGVLFAVEGYRGLGYFERAGSSLKKPPLPPI